MVIAKNLVVGFVGRVVIFFGRFKQKVAFHLALNGNFNVV